MDANLDLLLTVVYCIADDFLAKRAGNARWRVADAEIITLCIPPGDHGYAVRSAVLGRCSTPSGASVVPVPAGA